MCSCKLGFADRLNLNEQRFSALALEILLELRAELLYKAVRGHGGLVAQRVERAAQHVFGQVLNVVDVLLVAAAGMKTRERLLQPVRALATRNAPATALVLVEPDRP